MVRGCPGKRVRSSDKVNPDVILSNVRCFKLSIEKIQIGIYNLVNFIKTIAIFCGWVEFMRQDVTGSELKSI